MLTAVPTVTAEWDVVRAPQLGFAAMAILRTRAGAVVEDPAAFAHALPDGEAVTLPPTRCTEGPGPHWRICAGDDGWLTDPDALAVALADVRVTPVGEERTQ
ncbi:hypothetical protein ACH4JS_04150 [Streptomyces sp. NPDC017638]|uniref:hypothetical protein n=1 Tax=Streptomyces sp. NPDC017638 TaxID=3365004 RepID=UPI0037BBBB5E